IVVTSKLAEFATQCAGKFPSTMQPGDMAVCEIKKVKICQDFTDVVKVSARSATDHTTVTTTPTSILTDSVNVHIKPIAVHCVSTLASSIDADDNPNDNCVTLSPSGTNAPVKLTTIIYNDSDVALDVTVKNLPLPLVDCFDDVTPITVPQPIFIPARGT